MLGVVFVFLNAPLCSTQEPQLYTKKLPYGQAAVKIEPVARQFFSGTGHSHLPQRHMLASSKSQLEQIVNYTFSDVFPEEFNYFVNSDLSGYTLPPVQGKCSLDPALNPAVADCAAANQLCCFNATDIKVGQAFQHHHHG